MSLVSEAVAYMNQTQDEVVFQTDMLKYVSQKTGCSIESVRGTVVGATPRKLFGQPSFKENWVVCRREKGRGARYVKKGSKEAVEKGIYNIDYDTEAKRQARERGLQYVSSSPANYMTLASSHGWCVRYILDKCPAARVFNVERDFEVLQTWKKQGFPTLDYQCNISKFIAGPVFASTNFRLVNLDLMGAVAGYLDEAGKIMNRLANSEYIVLTVQGIKRFRNHGPFVDWARLRFQTSDPTLSWLRYRFNKYKVIDRWFYRRDPTVDCRGMRMFVLERK